MIDGTGGLVLRNAAVVIEGERITEVGPRDAVAYPAGAEVVDISGMVLLPGLIDCHDHLASPGLLGPVDPGQAGTGYNLVQRWELDAPFSLRTMRTAFAIEESLSTGRPVTIS